MRDNLVPIMMVLIVVAFCAAAYYYWQGSSSSERALTGRVIDKFTRSAGTEAGDKPLKQGLRVLSGQSFQRNTFYFIRVKLETGGELDIEVPQSSFQNLRIGDRVRRESSDSVPTLVR